MKEKRIKIEPSCGIEVKLLTKKSTDENDTNKDKKLRVIFEDEENGSVNSFFLDSNEIVKLIALLYVAAAKLEIANARLSRKTKEKSSEEGQ